MTTIIFIIAILATANGIIRYKKRKYNGLDFEPTAPTHAELDEEVFSVYANEYLNTNFSFFKELNIEDKNKFVNRMIDFIKEKRIVGMDDVIIDNELLLLVSMPAIRITFGLEEYILPNIRTIGVYPSIFYNNYIQQEAKGLTFVTGVTYFSLEHLKLGNANESDNLNLGLHEMGHAFKLYVDNFANSTDDLVYEMKEFTTHSEAMLKLIEQGQLDYLREYAGTNTDEFFAVCIENFFEKSYPFRTALPNTYHKMAKMLNQYPAG